jgi:putative transposase
MKYNPEIHHRKSIRIKEYDYSQSGYYFVTICSYNRENIFGKIIDGKIELNDFGEIVKDELRNTERNRLYVEIDYYCIMPNHLHFILIINDRGRDTARRVPTETFGNPVKGSLPTIIRSIKSAITKKINEIRKSPGVPIWQRNYYEHIIRNEKELYEIRKYIENNPLNWNRDEYNLL